MAADTSTDCGTLRYGSAPSSGASAVAAFKCFEQAFSTCAQSALRVTYDAGSKSVTRSFIVAPAETGCNVVEVVEMTVNGSVSSNAYQCRDLRPDSAGLVVRQCGVDGDRMLPSEPGSPAAVGLLQTAG